MTNKYMGKNVQHLWLSREKQIKMTQISSRAVGLA
jgi:hypothetical protein